MLVPESEFDSLKLSTIPEASKNTKIYRDKCNVRIVITPGYRKETLRYMTTLLAMSVHITANGCAEDCFPTVEAWEGDPEEGGQRIALLPPELVEDLLAQGSR